MDSNRLSEYFIMVASMAIIGMCAYGASVVESSEEVATNNVLLIFLLTSMALTATVMMRQCNIYLKLSEK